MGGIRKIWNDGEALTTTELQRSADAGAHADELANHGNIVRGSAVRGVGDPSQWIVPLSYEAEDDVPTSSGALNKGRRLVMRGTAGHVSILPCEFFWVTDQGTVSEEVHSAKMLASSLAAPNHATVAGTRWDVVYAVVTRTATSASRRVKSVVDGTESTQTIDVYSTPNVTLAILPNITVVGSTPTQTEINIGLPSTTTTVGYFPLAAVKLVAFTSGGTLASTDVYECWYGGFINQSRVHGMLYGSLVNKATGTIGKATTRLSNRWGKHYRMGIPSEVTAANVTASQVITLDDSIDWSRRMVTIRGCITPQNLALEDPSGTNGGADGDGVTGSTAFIVGPLFTGEDGTTFRYLTPRSGLGTGGNALALVQSSLCADLYVYFFVDDTHLQVLFESANTQSATAVWWFEIEFTDKFSLNPNLGI